MAISWEHHATKWWDLVGLYAGNWGMTEVTEQVRGLAVLDHSLAVKPLPRGWDTAFSKHQLLLSWHYYYHCYCYSFLLWASAFSSPNTESG